MSQIDSYAAKRVVVVVVVGVGVGVGVVACWGVGPDIVDVGFLPGPTWHRWGLGKVPAGAPLDLH